MAAAPSACVGEGIKRSEDFLGDRGDLAITLTIGDLPRCSLSDGCCLV